MYLGFSKMSPHYREVKNSACNDTKPLSPENVPVSVHPESIVYELIQALSDMQKERLVDEFNKRWVGWRVFVLGSTVYITCASGLASRIPLILKASV